MDKAERLLTLSEPGSKCDLVSMLVEPLQTKIFHELKLNMLSCTCSLKWEDKVLFNRKLVIKSETSIRFCYQN